MQCPMSYWEKSCSFTTDPLKIFLEVFFKFKYFIIDVTVSYCPCVTSIFYSSNCASSVWMRLKVGLITDSHRYIITVIVAQFRVFSKKNEIFWNFVPIKSTLCRKVFGNNFEPAKIFGKKVSNQLTLNMTVLSMHFWPCQLFL